MASLDGQKAWEGLQNYLPEERKSTYFRLNHEFKGKEPLIDDLAEMHQLNKPREHQTKTELEIVESLVTTQFYFEFDGPPPYLGGRYHCSGRLRCRFQGSRQTQFLNYALRISAGFTLGDKPIPYLRRPLQMQHGVFMEHVSFCVNELNEEITIFLTKISGKPKAISGFPTTIATLMRNQGLDSAFGTPNHSKRLSDHMSPVLRKRPRELPTVRVLIP
jgi:hypothetical protein